jgi:hypothetical protein
MSKKQPSNEKKLVVVGLIISGISCLATVVGVPEIRCSLGLKTNTCQESMGFINNFLRIFSQSNGDVSTASTSFGLDIVACRYTFDWVAYVEHVRKVPNWSSRNLFSEPIKIGESSIKDGSDYSSSSIEIVNRTEQKRKFNPRQPYRFQGCVRQKSFTAQEGARYSDFEDGTEATKGFFGDDLVLGLYQNKELSAQGNLSNYNRVTALGLSTIFSPEQLNQIYSTGGSRTAMPRVFSTGPDKYVVSETTGEKTYQGGWCKAENGQIKLKLSRAGTPFDPTIHDKNLKDAWHSCARVGKRTVEDSNLSVYQAIYEFKFPDENQCVSYFGTHYKKCSSYFQARYARDLAGATSGRRVLSIQTSFGTFDDTYSQWIGWINPDVGGIRSQSNDPFIKNFDGYAVFALD